MTSSLENAFRQYVPPKLLCASTKPCEVTAQTAVILDTTTRTFNFTELLFVTTSDAFLDMKIQVFWHVMLYHLMRGYKCSEGTITLQNVKNCSVTSKMILNFFSSQVFMLHGTFKE